MKTFLPSFLAVASLIAAAYLGISWQQSLAALDQKEAELQKQAREIQELKNIQAASEATNDLLVRRLGQLSANPFKGTVLNELDAAERRQRIPAGATDPDKVWKGQMKAARDTIEAAGIPVSR
ncbi:MAG: hypothetical protein IPK22_06410 [Verrucomicrobiaceae bacterium]|nr:hypothetical protein [Verrucomicrobiaceae bacterium]